MIKVKKGETVISGDDAELTTDLMYALKRVCEEINTRNGRDLAPTAIRLAVLGSGVDMEEVAKELLEEVERDKRREEAGK